MDENKVKLENMYRPGGKKYVHVNDNRILKIGKEYIEYLKSLAQKDSSGKCMMCLHNDIRANMHEMIFVFPAGAYIRPHSHLTKTETTIVIEGKLLEVIFDDNGDILDKYVIDKDGIFTTRIDKGVIHTQIPLTDVIFYESKPGPFTGKDDSIFPEWAPGVDDETGIRKIMDQINSDKK